MQIIYRIPKDYFFVLYVYTDGGGQNVGSI